MQIFKMIVTIIAYLLMIFFFIAVTIYAYLETKNKRKMSKELPHNIIQILNPKTNRYVKINRKTGSIISYKGTKGPYKGIPIIKK